MKCLLDTNAVIAMLKGDPALKSRLQGYRPADVFLSSIVSHELFFGAFESSRVSENVAMVDRLRFVVLDFDREDARRAGQLRADLMAKGAPIGSYDVLIAGQALSRSLAVITRNVGEFERVDGLTVETW